MVEEPRPDTNEKIRALCETISVAHNLDADIQDELYGHMEDKLLGYLNGEEVLSEEDAFILMREHFGDPAALKGLLQDVHVFEAQVSLARRLAAAIIVTAGVTAVSLFLPSAVAKMSPGPHGFAFTFSAIAFYAVTSALFPWLFLRYWQRRLDDGHTPWFLTRSPGYLVGAIVLLSALAIAKLLEMRSLFDERNLSESLLMDQGIWALLLTLLYIFPALQCMVWL